MFNTVRKLLRGIFEGEPLTRRDKESVTRVAQARQYVERENTKTRRQLEDDARLVAALNRSAVSIRKITGAQSDGE